jgi:Xaa-Pro aminopeptidase
MEPEPGARRSTAAHRARLAAIVAEHDLRAAVVSSYQAVSYFAGTHILTQVVVPDRLAFHVAFRGGAEVLLVCNLEASMVRSQTDVEKIREYVEFAEVPALALAGLLRERGVTGGRVGIEARRLQADAARLLAEALPGVELVPVDDAVEAAQAVKDEAEVEMLAYGARSTLAAVESAAAVAAGESELELCAEIAASLVRSGGLLAFLVFAAGERALQAHAEAVDRPLERGAIWRVDLGARFFEVVHSDVARTGVVGEPSAEQEDVLRRLRATQDAGFRALEPGRPASDVFEAVKAEFARQELPFFMPHIGHGLGIGLHEFPMLEPRNHALLEAGMVLNVEPMVRLPARGECYHTEDLALVTHEGPRLLTTPQERLLRIGG